MAVGYLAVGVDEGVMALEVTFLGTGDVFGSGGRLQTCIHVEAGSTAFLIDCGATAMPAMKRYGVDPNGIGTIFITHLHGDHFGGITYFVLDAQHASKRTDPLTIVGPPGVAGRVERAMEAMVPDLWGVEQAFDIEFLEYDPGVGLGVNGVVVTGFEVVHACGAPPFAVRIECEDRVIGYSGDTEWTPALVAAARGTDLFVSEAYFYERAVPYHLSYRTLMAHREELDTARLIVTHMNWDMLDRLEELEVDAAADGQTVTV